MARPGAEGVPPEAGLRFGPLAACQACCLQAQRRSGPRRVAVVGAGITGLAAAWRLVTGPQPVQVTVLEAGDQVGGKLRVAQLDGLGVDVGAEAMLARRLAARGVEVRTGSPVRQLHRLGRAGCRRAGVAGTLERPADRSPFSFAGHLVHTECVHLGGGDPDVT